MVVLKNPTNSRDDKRFMDIVKVPTLHDLSGAGRVGIIPLNKAKGMLRLRQRRAF
jgi:hypothetical protein